MLPKKRKYTLIISTIIFSILFAAEAPCQIRNPAVYYSFNSSQETLSDIFPTQKNKAGLKLIRGKFGNAVQLPEYNILGLSNPPDILKITADSTGIGCLWFDLQGKLFSDRGTVSFWLRRRKIEKVPLFSVLGTMFGTIENEVLSLSFTDSLALQLTYFDANHQRFTVETAPRILYGNRWEHIAIVWDNAAGLSVYVNGKPAAASSGDCRWWKSKIPSLLCLCASGAAIDELKLYDFPVPGKDIALLMKKAAGIPFENIHYTSDQVAGLFRTSGAGANSSFVTIDQSRSADSVIVFKEIPFDTPDDENTPVWWISDGGYELPVPYPYGLYDNVLGDRDYHYNHAVINPKTKEAVNYITLEGDLNGIRLLAQTGENLFGDSGAAVNPGFFTGILLKQPAGFPLNIPFSSGWGTPEGFTGDLHLPLNVPGRLQEIGLYTVSVRKTDETQTGTVYYLRPGNERFINRDNLAVLNAVFSPFHKTIFSGGTRMQEETVDAALFPFERFHFLTEIQEKEIILDKIQLNISLFSDSANTVLFINLHDPYRPEKIWSHAQVLLAADESKNIFHAQIEMDFVDIPLKTGQQIWIDCFASEPVRLFSDSLNSSGIVLIENNKGFPDSLFKRKQQRSLKAILSKTDFQAPWDSLNLLFTKTDNPRIGTTGELLRLFDDSTDCFSLPGSRLLTVTDKMNSGRIMLEDSLDVLKMSGVPEWALLYRELMSRRVGIAHQIARLQNTDGQFGCGWKNDSRIPAEIADLPLLGDEITRDMIESFYNGLDSTGLVVNGVAGFRTERKEQVEDFTKFRGNSILYNFGLPHCFERSMRAAWNFGKPDAIAHNYYFGYPFKREFDMVQWYWGIDTVPPLPSMIPEDSLLCCLKEAISQFSENMSCIFLNAGVFPSTPQFPGSRIVQEMALGGTVPNRETDFSVPGNIVSWEKGNPSVIARWIRTVSEKKFVCSFYNFTEDAQSLKMINYRIPAGNYKCSFGKDTDNNGEIDSLISMETRTVHRFTDISLDIPSGFTTLLELKRIAPVAEWKMLPDAAISQHDIHYAQDTLTINIHNIGLANVFHLDVYVQDEDGQILASARVEKIPPPVDFLPKIHTVSFRIPELNNKISITLDPNNLMEEIFKENNFLIFDVSTRQN